MTHAERWPVWAERANPHFKAALVRCVDHDVPVEKASFLGLLFFIAAASASKGDSFTLEEILTFKKAMNDALEDLAAAAIRRDIKG